MQHYLCSIQLWEHLDFAVFVLSRFWWQPDGGSRSVMKPGLRGAFLLKQRWGSVIPNGSHPWPSTGPGPVGRLSWLKTASEKDRQRVSYATLLWWDPFATACFSIYFSHRWDEPIFHWPPGFISLRTVIKNMLPLKNRILSKILKLTLV